MFSLEAQGNKLADENGIAQSQFNWPLAVFPFNVKIGDDEVAFQEASGLEAENALEPVYKAGANGLAHHIPIVTTYPNVVMKRGVARHSGGLVQWCKEVFEGGIEQALRTVDIEVNLLDKDGEPAASWSLKGAWPVLWSSGGLDAERNAFAIETIEFACNRNKRTQ